MQYYDLRKNWHKVKPYLNNKKVQRTLIRDMNILFKSRWKQEFEPGKVPHDYETCDWWTDHKGRIPAYWQYVMYGACHWLVNFNLELAKLVEPSQDWRIVKSNKHSIVWNDYDLLFEFNHQALGVPPDESFEAAITDGKILKIGRQRKCHKLEFWLDEIAREKKQCEEEGRVFVPHG